MTGESYLSMVLVVALVVVMVWFAVGTHRNIRRGNRLLQWVQTGLPLLGRRTTLRWLGSSAAQLTIRNAHDPFRQAEVVVVLEPRDVSLLWAWARARNRRDFLILRGWLVRAPTFELEAGDRTGWTGGGRFRRTDPNAFEEADWGDPDLSVRHTPYAEVEMVRRFWEGLGNASGGVWRVSIRREPPHLEVHVLPPPETIRADRLFQVYRDLGRTLVE